MSDNPKTEWYKKAGEKVVEQLQRRHFEAFYFESKDDAVEKIFSLMETVFVKLF